MFFDFYLRHSRHSEDAPLFSSLWSSK